MNKKLLKKLIRRQANSDISDGAFVLLLYIYACGGEVEISLTELAEQLNVTSRTVSYRINSLVEKGYVEKVVNNSGDGYGKNTYIVLDIK